MSFEDTNLWYAKNKDNNIVTVDKVNEDNRNEDYFCPICMNKIIPRLGEKVTHHFAHIDASKCTNESFVHFWVKNKMLSVGDDFTIRLTEDNKLSFKCKEILVEKEYDTKYGKYKPDITVLTTDNQTIYFEIAYTNAKRVKEYYDKWDNLNNIVVEVSTKELINGNKLKEFKCIYSNHNLHNVRLGEGRDTSDFRIYKQNIFDTCKLEEAKKRLEKIEWFWCECVKRKMNKISDEDFFDVIDCLNIDDRLYVIDKVLKSSCTDIRWLYLYNKQKEIKEFLERYVAENKQECISLSNLVIDCDKELINRSIFNKKFQIPCVKLKFGDNIIFNFHSDYFDKDNSLRLLSNYKLYNNCNLEYKIKSFNNILKYLLPNYNLSIGNHNNYDNFEIFINFNENNLGRIVVRDIKNDDIFKIATHEIYKYKNDINLSGYENQILQFLNNKNTEIEKLNKINDYTLSLKVNYFREDEFVVYLKMTKLFSEKEMYLFLIKSDEIRNSEGIIKFATLNVLKTNVNKLIQDKIREMRYRGVSIYGRIIEANKFI